LLHGQMNDQFTIFPHCRRGSLDCPVDVFICMGQRQIGLPPGGRRGGLTHGRRQPLSSYRPEAGRDDC
jgi:hypothetical protein